jgi:DivIVA domain-containing protein
VNRFPRVLGVRTGYDPDQVDALVERIEATLGRGPMEGAAVTADEIRMARFDTKLGGYNEVAVDYALDAFVVAVETHGRYAPDTPNIRPIPNVASVAVEAVRAEIFSAPHDEPPEDDDAPTLPGLAEAASGEPDNAQMPVAEVLMAAWLETQAVRVERVLFRPGRLGAGYNEDEVDVFLDRIVATLRGTTDQPLTAEQVRKATFSTVVFKTGYAVAQVDAFLAEMADVLGRHEALVGEEQQTV